MQRFLLILLGPLTLLATLLYGHHGRMVERTAYAPYEYVVHGANGVHDREYRARLQLHGITVVTVADHGITDADLARWERHNAQVEADLMASTGNARILHDLDEQARSDYRAHHPRTDERNGG